ncbi:unnamed protein product, partial [Ectocarpus fasciculatus]
MSDEDSFKRGTVRSRRQVEHHVRRLAIPLLKRAGERAHLHKEAPETLRFGFRRASKGYGVRVSRQCPVSSGVAAAFAVLPPAAAGGAGVTGASTDGTGMEEGDPTAAAEAALSEAVRLVMALFDKMVYPEEEEKGKLDLTLLSVGLAGFRGLGGGAQSGMARYLEASQPSRTTGAGSGPTRTT